MKKQTSRRIWTVAAVALALGVTFAAVGEAQTARGRGRAQNAPKVEKQKAPRQRLADRLKLSDAQKEQLADLRNQAREDAILRRGKMADLRAQMRVEFMKDTVDKSKVRSLEKEIQALRDQGSSARLEHRLSTLDVLTVDQRKELKKFRSEGWGRTGRHGRGMMGGRGMHGRGMMGGRGWSGRGMHQGPMMQRGTGRGMMQQGWGQGMRPGRGVWRNAQPGDSDSSMMMGPGDCQMGPGLGALFGDGFGPADCPMASNTR
jgi:Spy/CpxP family protein refolding chaperone